MARDSEGIAKNVCAKVSIDAEISYKGVDVENVDDDGFRSVVQRSNLFAELSRYKRERVMQSLQTDGRTVYPLAFSFLCGPPGYFPLAVLRFL